jgi:hypothetical protein
MSIQLADLYATYVVFAKNAQTKTGYDFTIVRSLKYNIWYVGSQNQISLCCNLNSSRPLILFTRSEFIEQFFESNELDAHKYETAEQALAVLQAWADKFGYVLSALS